MQIPTKQCPQLVSLSLEKSLDCPQRAPCWDWPWLLGEGVQAHWHACEEALATTLIFPFPPTSGWQLTLFSKHGIQFCKCRLLYWVILKTTAASYPWTQGSAGPSSLDRKAVRTGFAAKISHDKDNMLFHWVILYFPEIVLHIVYQPMVLLPSLFIIRFNEKQRTLKILAA